MRILAVIMVFTLSVIRIHAQYRFDGHAGVVIPTGFYASTSFEDQSAGGAAMGFNIGLQYTFQVNKEGAGMYLGIDYVYNSLSSEIEDVYDKFYTQNGYWNMTQNLFEYHHFPISLGFNYQWPLYPEVQLVGQAGFVFDFLVASAYSAENYKLKVDQHYSSDIGLGLKGGLRILYQDQYFVSTEFYVFQDRNVSVESSFVYRDVNLHESNKIYPEDAFSFDGKLSVSFLNVGLGMYF